MDQLVSKLFVNQGQVPATLTCIQLHKKAERIGAVLIDKAKLNTGDHVALVYPPGLDLICAFYGCLYVGEYHSTALQSQMAVSAYL